MGTITRPIGMISSPTKVSLASNPNFIEVSSLMNKYYNINARLIVRGSGNIEAKTVLTIRETASGNIHTFEGTANPDKINDQTFLLSEDAATVAENIRNVFLKNAFFSSNFKVEILHNTSTISIKSLGAGKRFDFSIEKLDRTLFDLEGGISDEDKDIIYVESVNNDSISKGTNNVGIEIDLYRDTGIFLGMDDTPVSNQPYGEYVTSLSKAYMDNTLWFDINAVPRMMQGYHTRFMHATTWTNSGTYLDYRFTGKRKYDKNKELFYISDVFYVLNGYKRSLEENSLKDYIYHVDGAAKNGQKYLPKPLTEQPALFYIKGESQYFNFILSNPNYRETANNCYIGLKYSLYYQSGQLITEIVKQEKSTSNLSVVNTVKLVIDELLEEYDNIGTIKVSLSRSESKDGSSKQVFETISQPLTFNILPDCLYKVHDFAFLNRLGGWSSFNFAGTEKTDFKTKATTIYQTHTPDKTISSEIESVYGKEVSESFTVETMPIAREVCDWLRELSTSKAVYELSTGRYVIVDELNIKHDTKDELFRMEMKYHYSDSYNARIE